MSQRWRRLVLASGLLSLSAGGFILHTCGRGQAELAASEVALAAGEQKRALLHARRAAAAYVPGAEHVEVGYARLRAIALGAERDADVELAASAWQAMRGAALASAHLWQPQAAPLAQANEHLARLRGFTSPTAGGLAEPPHQGVTRLLLALGFLGAIGGLGWFCACAWPALGSGRLARAAWPALAWCMGVLVLGWALLHA